MQSIDWRVGGIMLAFVMPFIIWALKCLWDTDIRKELNDAIADWQEIKKQIGHLFKNRSHTTSKELYAALGSFFVGSCVALFSQIVAFLVSFGVLVILCLELYGLSFWATGGLQKEEFKVLFVWLLGWLSILLIAMVAIRVAIRAATKITRTEHARVRE